MGLIITLGVIVVVFPNLATALILVLALSSIVLMVFRHFADDKDFVTRVFFVALFVRLGFGIYVHIFDLREFFGGDANTYDYIGNRLMEIWSGHAVVDSPMTQRVLATTGAGWGMNYLVGAIYYVLGRNIFAAQSLCGLIGASTAPMMYLCAQKIFQNIRVAKYSAIAIALFPSFVIWSSQLMKDGIIIFLLVLAMTMILQLQEKFNYPAVAILVLSLFGIMSLRFYIFYMVLVAVAGSFLIGTSSSIRSMARRSIALVLLGLGLTYVGVIRTANVDLGKFGSLAAVQRTRSVLATSAQSGFGADLDVSTTDGAISAVPIGLMYLMLAPFPWQVTNLRQSIALPEVIIWWSMIPLMISGLMYSLRNKLRKSIPVLIFTLTLTLAYSIFQGNVGTAYRQRTQIQVFLFMFIAVGWVLFKEKRENRALEIRIKRKLIQDALLGRSN